MIKIELIETGYLITAFNSAYTTEERYAFDNLLEVLHFIKEIYKPGSRHDEKRIYVVEAPGDKHELFTEEHSKVLFGD